MAGSQDADTHRSIPVRWKIRVISTHTLHGVRLLRLPLPPFLLRAPMHLLVIRIRIDACPPTRRPSDCRVPDVFTHHRALDVQHPRQELVQRAGGHNDLGLSSDPVFR